MRRTVSALLGTAAILVVAAAPAAAQDFGSVIAFGDSLADSGNIPALTGGANVPPPPYVGNRFSNGPVVPEYLDDLLGAETGPNLAVGGAFSGKINGIGNGNAAQLPSLNDTDLVTTVDRFVAAGNRIAEDDVVYIWGGTPNDYFATLPTLLGASQGQAAATIAQTVGRAQANVFAASSQLIAAGARNIVLGTLPDFGTIPQFSNQGAVTAAAAAFSTANNQALVDTANRLGGRANVTLVDYASLITAVQADPAAFGFTNVTGACIQSACALAPTDVQNQFLFFDGVHPTTAGHRIAAAATADAIAAPFETGAVLEASEVAARAFTRDLLGEARASFITPEFRSADLPDVAAPFDESAVRLGAVEVAVSYDRIDFDRSARAAAAGFDLEADRIGLTAAYVTNGFRIGVAGAYEDGDVTSGRTNADLETYRGGIFAGAVAGLSPFVNVYASAALDFSYVDYEASRDTRIAGFRAESDTSGFGVGLAGEVRVTQRLLDSVEVGPIARLGLADVNMDGFTETGAPLGVNRQVRDVSRGYAYGEIGLGLTYSGVTGLGLVEVGLAALYHDGFDDDGTGVRSNAVTLPGFVSDIDTGGDRDGEVRIEADIDIVTARGLTIGLEGDATFGDDLDGYGLGASLGYRF